MNTRIRERGVASLAVALILLFGMTLVAFFANRSLVFEQRTSANQYRSTKAFELAEAGIEWAISRLNEPSNLVTAPSCSTTTTWSANASFRDRYIRPTSGDGVTHTAGYFNPRTDAYPGCSIANNGAATCGCPTASGTAATVANTTDARFRVQFKAVTGDEQAVEIVSRGCTTGDSCDPVNTPSTSGDGTAIVRVVIKVVPTISKAPAAALTAGTYASTGGNVTVINTEVANNGITINSGSYVTTGGGTEVVTIPGTPPRASIFDSDSSLLDLTNADSNGDLFFSSFFGASMSEYKNNPLTKIISSSDCSTSGACGQLVSTYYDQGWRQFWVTPDVSFTTSNLPTAGTLGTETEPITIVGQNVLELKANLTAYGTLYASETNWNYTGSGSATIFGAMIARGSFTKGAGSLNLVYDSKVFGNLGPPHGLLVRVPGSWRDKSSDF